VTSPLQRDALRLIQDIVIEAKGSPLDQEALRRVEAALAMAAPAAPAQPASYSERDATIVFADLRGFSAIAAAHPVDQVLGVLNRCFGMLADIVLRHYGTIDKFMGDAIMAVFHGDPASPSDHARRAVLCALEMQLAIDALRSEHAARKLPEIYLGVGISTGKVMAGLIGSEAYRAYTVIGEEVNIAARIEALALRGQVLISEATFDRVKDFVQVGAPMAVHVKGRAEPMEVREALGIPALGKVVPRQDARKSPRVPVTLALECWRVDGKRVRAEAMHGTVRDLSYHGMLGELPGGVPLYGELKLAFDLPPLGHRAAEIYARIVSLREAEGGVLAGVEFTSLDDATAAKIRLFVQMLLQGEFAAAR
jgi:adenylate cyclase